MTKLSKKHRLSVCAVFTASYAILLSLGETCFLNLLGIVFGVSLDGASAVDRYPRFIPFCVAVGLAALVLIVAIATLNVKLSEKLNYTKRVWIVKSACAILASIPEIWLWEMIFHWLQRVF